MRLDRGMPDRNARVIFSMDGDLHYAHFDCSSFSFCQPSACGRFPVRDAVRKHRMFRRHRANLLRHNLRNHRENRTGCAAKTVELQRDLGAQVLDARDRDGPDGMCQHTEEFRHCRKGSLRRKCDLGRDHMLVGTHGIRVPERLRSRVLSVSTRATRLLTRIGLGPGHRPRPTPLRQLSTIRLDIQTLRAHGGHGNV
ncbi:hypothetical protein FIU86_16500 [Roseovarius sp. THAF9]|nr:hypothetical protein FIU86_16500 [Roseovarius sp. THAF9]